VIGVLLFFQVFGTSARNANASAQKSKQQAEKPPTVISVNATGLHFDPSVLHLKVDERYELHVMSDDTTRGIRISPFPDGAQASTPPGLFFPNGEDCWKLNKGQTVLIGVVPTEPGTYAYSCCKGCGNAGGKMTGQIIVER
jgi:heme/copper-type cytochrome/quinol oxidase subunit 2